MVKQSIRWLFFIYILTLPLWNGFRIDIDQNKLYLLGYQLTYYNGYLFFLFLMLFLIGFLALATLIYRAFCRYACPHNTFSDLLNKIEKRFRGKGKLFTFILSVLISSIMAFSTVSYFYNPVTILQSLINFEMNKYFFLVTSLTTVYVGLTYKARSSFCKVCPFGIAQGISTVEKPEKWFYYPGVWITWGTTTILALLFLIGWF